MINGHGDDIYNYDKPIKSNYSSNIYNKLDLTALQSFLCSRINRIHSYPEPDANSLKRLIAEKNNISFSNICVTNGATEAIYLIAQAFNGKTGSILIPTFSEYEDACLINNISLRFAKSLDEIENKTEICWICNPNNPTGKTISKKEIISFIESHPDMTVILDQSYQYFTEKESLTIKEAINYQNVICLHSMTKQYAIPGLRLGYVTACMKLIEKIQRFYMPWSVNQLAQEAGKYLLKNESSFTFDLKGYLNETNQFQKKLSNIKGLRVYPTDTHFFLCKLENGEKAINLKIYLANQFGILIRDAANFRGLDNSYFRLATQSKEENDILIKAIQSWMK